MVEYNCPGDTLYNAGLVSDVTGQLYRVFFRMSMGKRTFVRMKGDEI